MEFVPVILCGGAGSRLWPLSREFYPKPLLPVVGSCSLLEDTVQRLDQVQGVQAPLVVCNEAHRFLVADRLAEGGHPPGSIILESTARDTAPALTLAALEAQARQPDALLVVMPADHVIPDRSCFARCIESAGPLALEGFLVTFGIPPDRPETGYGYIHRGERIGESGGFAVSQFVEKPDSDTAQGYLDSGEYYWNSGIFVMRADRWIEEIGRYRPIILAACRSALAAKQTDAPFVRVDAEAFAACPAESIDYAVVENTGMAAMLPLSTAWSDVGSWSAIRDLSAQDVDGNACRGDVLLHDTRNSLLIAESRCLATVGLDNVTVVETKDAVLVASNDKCQEVKAIVARLKACEREEHRFHSRVHRPWGNYEGIDKGSRYQVKRITVSPGAKLSLQMHHHRAEHWVVVRGTAKVIIGDRERILSENQSAYVPLGQVHRLENPGTIPLEIIEVQSGSYLGEDDIVRFEDIYKRSSDVAV